LREAVAEARSAIERGEPPAETGEIIQQASEKLCQNAPASLKPMFNLTGTVLHTNLGRSLLPDEAVKAISLVARQPTNLEYDINTGLRGDRDNLLEQLLRELTGAEAATVVNNNAAAVFLVLNSLAAGREVPVSRGELVEIGGSFRIPDIMSRSGCRLVEIGTTNRTHNSDYRNAINENTALLMKVHTSNYKIQGFTLSVSDRDVARIAADHKLPFITDLGSGNLIDLQKYGLPHEPTVRETLENGADLVTFSGDKLLGGPQAGIILGRKDLVEAIKKNQLSRALRIDKLTLLALEETLTLYRDERAAVNEIPTLEMICQSYDGLDKKAQKLTEMLAGSETENYTLERIDGCSKIGGGALPLQELPTRLLCLTPKKMSAQEMEGWLRSYDPPIIVRIETDQVLLDMRTIQERELKTVAQALKKLATA